MTTFMTQSLGRFPHRQAVRPSAETARSRVGTIFVLLAACLAAGALTGCRAALMDPKGQVAVAEKSLVITTTLLMLVVVIPVIFMTLYFAWKYRESNTEATYMPNWSYSHRIEAIVWAVPIVLIVILAAITWKSTHELDPYKPLDSSVKPITIEVVSLDWKWLFIYPDQHIATVNEVEFPANTPVNFKITSDTVMNVFFIPQLGSQIYAMAGMQTQVNLIANEAGVFDGLSTNFSGAGFPDMKFKAHAVSQGDFDAWVAKVKASPKTLGLTNYNDLAKPSEKDSIQYFANVEPILFPAVLDKYMDKSSGLKLADKFCLPATKVVASANKDRAE